VYTRCFWSNSHDSGENTQKITETCKNTTNTIKLGKSGKGEPFARVEARGR
jgi:hypothetical protein